MFVNFIIFTVYPIPQMDEFLWIYNIQANWTKIS